MDYGIFDIEADGLIETVTKVHCMVVIDYTDGVRSVLRFTDLKQMESYVERKQVLIGHSIARYDVPVLKKFYITVKSRIIDTLGLSWYLYPNRNEHGLESWGNDLGVPKPVIADWTNLTVEEYLHRCEKDCEINEKLFHLQLGYLKVLYDNNSDNIDRIMNYLTYKLDCAREQEEMKWRLDVVKCEANLAELMKILEEKKVQLSAIMPKNIKYKVVSRPKVLHKKDGEPSEHGKKWFELLKSMNLPEYHVGAIKVPAKEEPGNPGSHDQLKDWLFSLGWVPVTFKYSKEKDGSIKKIPQVNKENSGGICDSIKALYPKEPNLELLDSYFIIRHRIGILKGFLENKDENGFLKACIKGFTNTLRFQHTGIVNLPKVDRPYGEYARGCLIAPDDNHVLCGSDMSSLEDSTKQHYMYFFDPDYVREMRVPGFDPHIDIAVLSGMITADDAEFYKQYEAKLKADKDHVFSAEDKARYKQIKSVRGDKAKKTNFSAVYGAGAPKIALTAGIVLPEAKLLHTTYWKRNKAVKQVEKACITKKVYNQMWLYNPVSRFWYSLRAEKDKFSTLNQGTGVYCFDTWVRHNRNQGIRICGQFHDEIAVPVLKGAEDEVRKKLNNSIQWANEELKLNVPLGISIDFGDNYAQIH